MAFCKKVTDTRKILLSLFEKISREGKKISGYGAPAKASTLINFVGADNLEYIYDKSDLKQGKFIPGTSIKLKILLIYNMTNQITFSFCLEFFKRNY